MTVQFILLRPDLNYYMGSRATLAAALDSIRHQKARQDKCVADGDEDTTYCRAFVSLGGRLVDVDLVTFKLVGEGVR